MHDDLPQPLHPLVGYLDRLTNRASIEALSQRLRVLDVGEDDLAAFIRFDDEMYRRNLVCEGRWYHVLVICWKSGQRSPIHNHAHSTCGMRVLSGIGTETMFESTPSGQIKAAGSRDWQCGDVTASQDSETHQVSNLQASGVNLVTLHIYSPPLLSMDTYSLTSERIGKFQPMILAHEHGSGI